VASVAGARTPVPVPRPAAPADQAASRGNDRIPGKPKIGPRRPKRREAWHRRRALQPRAICLSTTGPTNPSVRYCSPMIQREFVLNFGRSGSRVAIKFLRAVSAEPPCERMMPPGDRSG